MIAAVFCLVELDGCLLITCGFVCDISVSCGLWFGCCLLYVCV